MTIMGSCKMLWILVLIHLVHCLHETDDFNRDLPSFGPSWQYKCVPELGCQRTSHPFMPPNPSASIFNSLDVCRTVCGHFGGLWPKPITAVLSMQTVGIHPSKLRFDMNNAPAEVQKLLEDMTHVARDNLLGECGLNVTQSADTNVIVHIEVESSCTDLTWDTDEEYRLNVQTRDDTDVIVRIVAKTVFGARHGLETFTQLVAPVKSAHLGRCGLRLISRAEIRDRPAYGYRGLLLDSSRNFVPMRDIKRMIDGMASTKLNVFHWHVTDSQSFPLESIRVPQFTRYGAYSPEEIYTKTEVEELVEYAKVRGVRVVIEIDAPAHAGNGWQWGKDYGLGDLAVCVNAINWRQLCIQPPCGQLNPANPEMYKVLKKLYRDIADVLPKPALFHMGGDEVFIKCWNSSDEIASYMGDKGMETTKEGYIELWAEFHNKALQMWDEVLSAEGENAQPVMLWSSELTQADRIETYLDKERYVIEVWEPLQSPLLNQLLALGYRTISIPKDLWYLDHGFWGETRYSNWRKMYSYTLPRHRNMLGGEVAMWSEYVDVNALDARVWPRAAAVAERLWADPPPYQLTTAEPRLQRHRQRLIARGLRPDVIGPEWCAQNDAKCV